MHCSLGVQTWQEFGMRKGRCLAGARLLQELLEREKKRLKAHILQEFEKAAASVGSQLEGGIQEQGQATDVSTRVRVRSNPVSFARL
jgi:hypothetical protein